MLVAVNERGERIEAWRCERGATGYCPGCRDRLVLKLGTIVIAHFAHSPLSECVLATGESLRHLQMKEQITSIFKNARLEVSIDCSLSTVAEWRRADVLVGPFVIECQASPISLEAWQARTAAYTQMRLPMLWVWDLKRITGRKTFSELDRDIECRVPAEIRYYHRLAFGHLYALDINGQIAGVHLGSAETRWREGGPTWDDSCYTPKTLRCPRYQVIDKPRLQQMLGADKSTRLATLGEPVWWKQ